MHKIGMISYLNTAPFRYGFHQMEGVELVEAVPAKLLALAQSGEVETAIMPAFDVLAHPELVALPGTCIASDGPAMSIKLFGRIPLRFAATVALDADSHTSVALTRLLAEVQNAHPVFLSMPPDLDAMLAHADIALLIGDPCLRAKPPQDVLVQDLGQEWKDLTGLPCVYGMWAARPEADAAALTALTTQALEIGLANLEAVAAEESGRAGLLPEGIRSYLRDHMRYHLDDACLAGLEQFRQRLVAHGLLADTGPVRVA